MKLCNIGNTDILSDIGLHKTESDFIAYGELPEDCKYEKWRDLCKNYCERQENDITYNVIREEGRIIAYFTVEYIEVFDDFYGVGMKMCNYMFRNGYTVDDNKEGTLSDFERKYIIDKLEARKYTLKPYVTEKIQYFILKIL